MPSPSEQQPGVLHSRPDSARPAAAQAAPGWHRLHPGAGGTRATLVRVPSGWRPDRPAPLAVLLHGSGGEPEQGLSLLDPFADEAGLIVVAPASTVYTWDGILGRCGPDVLIVDAAMRWVFERYAVDPARIAVGGFSDGASYALSLACGNGDLFTHCIALSPGFIPPAEPKGRPRIFVSHGTRDRVLPIARCSRVIVPSLRDAGYAVEYREFEGGHEIPSPIAGAAVEWMMR